MDRIFLNGGMQPSARNPFISVTMVVRVTPGLDSSQRIPTCSARGRLLGTLDQEPDAFVDGPGAARHTYEQRDALGSITPLQMMTHSLALAKKPAQGSRPSRTSIHRKRRDMRLLWHGLKAVFAPPYARMTPPGVLSNVDTLARPKLLLPRWKLEYLLGKKARPRR